MDVEAIITLLGFDPCWSEEEAWQRRSPASDQRCPFVRWRAWRSLEACGRKYSEGDHQQLMEAIATCAEFGFPIPEWAAINFRRSYTNWRREKVRTLDQAFHMERPKGKRLNARYTEQGFKHLVLMSVEHLNREGIPIGPEIFERVGAEFKVSQSTVSRAYYAAKKSFRTADGDDDDDDDSQKK